MSAPLSPLDRARFRKQALLHIRQRRLARELRKLIAALIRPTVSPPARHGLPGATGRSEAKPASALSHSREAR